MTVGKVILKDKNVGGICLLKVIKRDCTEVEFDKSKISNAILKAMRNGSGIIRPKIAESIADEIYNEYDVIIVEFLVSTIDHYIGYDVIDNNTGTLYFPYYSNDNIHNLVEQKITKRIEEIFDELNNQNIITI